MRYAIVSDIHANIQAWEAVLADIRSQRIDVIVCLGDVVGYGPRGHCRAHHGADRPEEVPHVCRRRILLARLHSHHARITRGIYLRGEVKIFDVSKKSVFV